MTTTVRPHPPIDQEATTLAMTTTTTTTTIPTTMSTAETARTTVAADTTNRVSLGRLTRAEWLKFRSVRSNLYALGGAAGAAIGLGALFSSLAGTDDGPSRLADNALSLSLGGFDLAVMIIAILGVSLVATEYSTGLIRTWFAATSNRLGVLASKVGVYSGLTFVVTAAAAVAAFLIGQAVFPDASAALSLTDAGVWEALVGTAFYGACVAAMGVALGFILRSTAAGAGVVVTTLLLAPGLIGLLPDGIADPVGKILPSNAGSAITGLGGGGFGSTELLSATGGVITLLIWVAATVGAAALVLVRRDA